MAKIMNVSALLYDHGFFYQIIGFLHVNVMYIRIKNILHARKLLPTSNTLLDEVVGKYCVSFTMCHYWLIM